MQGAQASCTNLWAALIQNPKYILYNTALHCCASIYGPYQAQCTSRSCTGVTFNLGIWRRRKTTLQLSGRGMVGLQSLFFGWIYYVSGSLTPLWIDCGISPHPLFSLMSGSDIFTDLTVSAQPEKCSVQQFIQVEQESPGLVDFERNFSNSRQLEWKNWVDNDFLWHNCESK